MIEKLSDYQAWEKSELATVAGWVYFNPPAELARSGREIIVPELAYSTHMNLKADGEATYSAIDLFEILTSRLLPEESLFGLYRTDTYLLAPLLPNVLDLVAFEAQVQSGGLIRVGYYAIPDEVVDRALQ